MWPATGGNIGDLLGNEVSSTCLTYRLGKRSQVVDRGGIGELALVSHHLPAAWHGQPQRVLLAQVVTVWLGVGG